MLCSLSTWPTPLPASLLAPVVNELLRETQFLPKLYTISSSELAVLAVSLARQPTTADAQLWHQLVKALAVRSSQLQLSQLVDIVSLCVELKKHTVEFMSAAAAAVIRRRDPLSPDQVARLLCSYAAAGHPHPALTSALAQAACHQIQRYTPHQMIDILTSCVALGTPLPPGVLRDVSSWAQARMHTLTPPQLSQLAKALAMHSFYDSALASSIAAASCKLVAGFTPLQAVELLWAMSAWQHFNYQLCSAFATHAAADLAPYPPTTLAILLWSLSSLGYYSPQLFTAAATALAPHLHDASQATPPPAPLPAPAAAPPTPINQPSLTRDPPAARLPPPLPPALAPTSTVPPLPATPPADPAAAAADSLSPMSLYNVTWAYAAVRHHDAAFLHALEAAVCARAADFEPHELAGLLGAFADVNFAGADVARVVGAALAPRARELELEGAAVAAWGLAMGGSQDVALLQSLFNHAAGFIDEAPPLADVVRLRQAYILLKGRMYLNVPAPLQHMFDRTAADLRRFCGALGAARDAAVQEFRREVSDVLEALGASATPGVQTACGYFLVDLVVDCGNGLSVGVDLVTRDKVSNTQPRRLWGGTVAVRRCLEAEGWRVVGVDQEEWGALAGAEERRQLLLGELQTVIAELG